MRGNLATLTLLLAATAGMEGSGEPAAPTSLEEAVMRARAVLQDEHATKAAITRALLHVLAWVDQAPSPAEQDYILNVLHANPEDYVVVQGAATDVGGAVAQSDQGDVVLSRFQIVLPMAMLNFARVLGADGAPTSPFRGALPFAAIRWLVPKRCFKQPSEG